MPIPRARTDHPAAWCNEGISGLNYVVSHPGVQRTGDAVKLLLTSSGIANPSIHDALEDLLGKPIGESSALSFPPGSTPSPVAE
jgi:hypothetical protein